ncbi:MAG TPA: hypothetical protein VJA86_03525 [Candidatus Nanoarchaeia archaeon]|nr:hypothetical protein [Candidatus Nanoarchaeia archaeon]
MAKRNLYVESIIVASNVIVRYSNKNSSGKKLNNFDITSYFPQEVIDSLKRDIAELGRGEKENELKKYGDDWCIEGSIELPPNPQVILGGIEKKFLEDIKLMDNSLN